MRTLNGLVVEVSSGAKRVDDQVMIDRLYDAKCYWTGSIIRIDLKPVSAQVIKQMVELSAGATG